MGKVKGPIRAEALKAIKHDRADALRELLMQNRALAEMRVKHSSSTHEFEVCLHCR